VFSSCALPNPNDRTVSISAPNGGVKIQRLMVHRLSAAQ
jgi:hypothetical protein